MMREQQCTLCGKYRDIDELKYNESGNLICRDKKACDEYRQAWTDYEDEAEERYLGYRSFESRINGRRH